TGEDAIQHPLAVADILIEIRADSVTLAAALLHDVIEETDISVEELGKEFGEEIADLVGGLTAVKDASNKAKREAEDLNNLRHLIIATVKDPRVFAIRLAEKIHNLRTSYILNPEDRAEAARRVFSIWSPLAVIMGFYRFRAELEDLAFSILEPNRYRELEKLVHKESESLKETINLVRDTLEVGAAKEGIELQVFGRTKHLYGVHQKTDRYKSKAGGRLYDVLGLRALVDSVENCYRILDLARRFWEEEPELFDDYIANPKPNGYQSIHAVFTVDGKLVEVQIRTREMHEVAEYGLAAHPLYKERGDGFSSPARSGPSKSGVDERISMIREFVLWEKGKELNLFPDQVFVITPKGEVRVLPQEATPVDFAYAIHSRVGDECSEAKVDGRIKPLNYQLQTGEVVEIITKKGKKPSSDWLKFVKTPTAREQIEKSMRKDVA
ncbi:MAG: HD domain-containing protein, partial [bacterium]|nr:HD domain-containing protein [bacterium]